METRHTVKGVSAFHHVDVGQGQIFQQPDPGADVGWGGGCFKVAFGRHALYLCQDF